MGVVSMELVSHHPSLACYLELAPEFLENMWTPGLKSSSNGTLSSVALVMTTLPSSCSVACYLVLFGLYL
jgi:hypothetical protein